MLSNEAFNDPRSDLSHVPTAKIKVLIFLRFININMSVSPAEANV